VEVRDTTISSNQSTPGQDGGVFNDGLIDLRNVTLKDNTFGLYNQSGASLRLQSSVLDNGPDANCGGDLPDSGGFNLATDLSCGLSGFQDTQGKGLQAGLGPLSSDPAVFTLFHLPQAGSLGLNSGGPSCAPSDQRYAARPTGECDIGAIELHGLLARLFAPLVEK
jgi:hypothetical protein